MAMHMISVADLFYGEREAVQILKDEHREVLEIIHRYNYFYTEPPPLSDDDAESEASTTEDSEDEDDLESNWQEVESRVESESTPSSSSSSQSDESSARPSSVQEEDPRPSNASQPDPEQSEAKVILKVPMCCPECEETVAIALKNVAGVADVVTFLLKEMVTVTGTAPPGDLLLACRDFKLFRKTRLWRDDSD
ncbi:unnamed protein product [Calypogeia fissa]